MKTEGFRKPDRDYFNYVFCVSKKRAQVSPFMLCKNDTITSIDYSGILIEKAEKDDVILHAWPGKWKTDIFAYKFHEMLEYLIASNNL